MIWTTPCRNIRKRPMAFFLQWIFKVWGDNQPAIADQSEISVVFGGRFGPVLGAT
jgi:hypothetical protein